MDDWCVTYGAMIDDRSLFMCEGSYPIRIPKLCPSLPSKNSQSVHYPPLSFFGCGLLPYGFTIMDGFVPKERI